MLRPNKPPSATILVIDDNETNRSLARHTLEDEGYQVVLATGGLEGIAAFEREAVDCILLDVRMPDLDGFAVCERIRKMDRGASTPIVFLTASRDVDTFDRAREAGGDDFLPKPVRPAELVVRVQTALELQRLGAELRAHFDLLRRQRDDLLRLQLQKERLMAFVVHDLKNPVHTMDLHAQILVRDSSLSAETREAAGQIRGAARQLNRLILNLLDISKAEEGKLVPRSSDVNLEVLARGVASDLDVAAKAKGVSLALAIEAPRVRADEDLLRRALANLMENAIRHAPEGTTVRLSSAAYAGGTEIRVRDSGSGVPPSFRERIFDAFVQLDASSTTSRTGRGLGLAFCKLAVECHGGSIWLEDADPGAVFALRLPHEPR
jgi:two-component system, sensor histidine kinase and response regulator